jgi:hypothetical protein
MLPRPSLSMPIVVLQIGDYGEATPNEVPGLWPLRTLTRIAGRLRTATRARSAAVSIGLSSEALLPRLSHRNGLSVRVLEDG